MSTRRSSKNKKSRQGQLRIVAGKWRSRLLEIADVPGLRPTSERIRETLFNWLAPDIHGAKCLDICAGSGALGLEALSRGAAKSVFVELSDTATVVLRSNLAKLGADNAEIKTVDARKYLRTATTEAYDVVFLDPPFQAELYDELCRLLNERDWLAADARIYVEIGVGQETAFLPESWRIIKDKTAGKVRYLLVTTAE